MKLPSINKLFDSAYVVFRRFPFEMLFALAGTIAATAYTELESTNRDAESWCLRIILIANLGLLLSLATTLYTESTNTPAGKKLLLRLLAAVFVVALIFIINPFEREADGTRFALISLSFHLLVAFAGFTIKGHVQGFWQFNKALFLRFLTGVLYSMVLFAGISAAIGAMNFLFTFKFEWDTFVILWIWIAGMFNTLFFLAGVPDDLPALDEDKSYPKGLKIFTQYVLIPLATIYVLILLAYELKILVQWNLPKGLVSDLVLCYAVFGILSILLVYPVREQAENKWIKTYARSFYFLLLPLIVLLLLAVGTRVFRYGITESRYFLIVLAVWLLFITIYFLASKKQNVKLIPISLCILTLLAVYGPQSAFSVAKYSQQRILVNIFKRNNAFKDGKLLPVDSKKISKKDGNQAVATLDYLVDHHDLTAIAPYLSVDLNKISDSLGKQHGSYRRGFEVTRYELRQNKLEWIKKYLHLSTFWGYSRYGLTSPDSVENEPMGDSYAIMSEYRYLKVSGYDYVIDDSQVNNDTTSYNIDQLHIAISNKANTIYTVHINNEALSFNLKTSIGNLLKDEKGLAKYWDTTNNIPNQTSYKLPPPLISFAQTTKNYEVVFRVSRVYFMRIKDKGLTNFTEVQGSFLIRKLH